MKLIEALKKIKDLRRKADDIKEKIGQYCADMDSETPTYPDQKRQIEDWLQSHSDIIKEIGLLRERIHKTNLETPVSITLGGKTVTKSIVSWILRRTELAQLEETCWRKLTDRGLKESYSYQVTNSSPQAIVKRRLYFDPKQRDEKVELYRSEPHTIDSTLEVVNAVTDLKEL